MRRPDDVPRVAGGGRDSRQRGPARRSAAALPRGRRARRRARRGDEPVRRRAAGQAGRHGRDGEVPQDRGDRPPRPDRRRAAGRDEPRDFRRRGALRSLLRAGSVVADRVHHRRQRRRERRGRALPQVRVDGAQRPPRARRAHHRRSRRIRRRRARQRRVRPARARPRLRGVAGGHDRDHGQAHAPSPRPRRWRSRPSTMSGRPAQRWPR